MDLDSDSTVYSSYVQWAQRKNGPYVKTFQALAKELGIAIAAAYIENVDGETGQPQDRLPPRNAVAVIDRSGYVLHTFAKVHIAFDGTSSTDPEGITQAGRSYYTHSLDLGSGRGNVSVCSFICFDREHPESAALCAAGGAELILHPTACGFDDVTIRKIAARAMSNGVSIAMANFGNSTDNPSDDSWGRSLIVNATGDFLSLAEGDHRSSNHQSTNPGVFDPEWMEIGEGIYIAEVDIGAQRRYKETELGKALTQHRLEPALCRIPLAEQYQQGRYDIARMWL